MKAAKGVTRNEDDDEPGAGDAPDQRYKRVGRSSYGETGFTYTRISSLAVEKPRRLSGPRRRKFVPRVSDYSVNVSALSVAHINCEERVYRKAILQKTGRQVPSANGGADPQGRRLPADRTVHQGSRGSQGSVSHQCRGRSDAVAGGGRHGADQRSLADPGAGSDVAPIPISHPRLSFRQRQRVHQPHGSEAAEQTAGGTDQIAAGTPTTMAWRKPRTEQ